MNKKNIRVRKGQVQKSCRAMIFVRDFLTSSRIRPLAPRLVRSSASNHRVGRLYTASQSTADASGWPRLRRSFVRSVGRMARYSPSDRRSREAAERFCLAVQSSGDLGGGPQRRVMPTGSSAPTAVIRIQLRRKARMQRKLSTSSSPAGLIRSICRVAPTGWSCMAMWRASKECGARYRTGSIGWA
jgi:hypothetical protein